MTTDERMEKMEGQLARVRWFNRCLIACIVLSFGVWLISKTFGAETVWAGSGAKEIRANSFILEDENGKPRAELSVGKDGPWLSLRDENGKGRVNLSVDKDGPGLWLFDEKGKNRAGLSLLKDAPHLSLYGENGKLRAWLSVGKDMPCLRLLKENDKVIWKAP